MPINFNPSAMDMGGTLQLRGNWGTRNLLEAASADYQAGECVILSGDDVTQSDTAPGADAFSSALADNIRVAGIALHSASGTTGTPTVIAVPIDSSAQALMRIGSTTTGSNQEVQDVALGDLAPLYRYKSSVATGSKLRTTVGPAPLGGGQDKVVIVEKYDYKTAGGNAGDQVAGDDFGLVWVSFIPEETVFGRAVNA